jgi:hypothetical protein
MPDVETTRKPAVGTQAPLLSDGKPGGSTTDARQPDGRPAAPEFRMNRIARRAHEIYEARGGDDGKALNDWLQAEREIDAEIDAERGAGE